LIKWEADGLGESTGHGIAGDERTGAFEYGNMIVADCMIRTFFSRSSANSH